MACGEVGHSAEPPNGFPGENAMNGFEALFHNMAEGVALHGIIRDEYGNPVNYRLIDVNPTYEKILSLDKSTVVGKLATEAYGTETPPYLNEYGWVSKSGPFRFETYFPPMDKHFSISVVPWGEDGFATIFNDISESKRMEEELKKSLTFIETLLLSSPFGISVFDGETGFCVLANNALVALTGGTIKELTSQNFRNTPVWEENSIRNLAESVLSDGQARSMHMNIISTFGKRMVCDIIFSRFSVSGKNYLLAFTLDATERKRIEEEQRKLDERMLHHQKLESLGILAGGIAHDFNNILMSVLGNADLAMQTIPALSPVREYLEQIEISARRAADLSRQMLAYSGKGRFVNELIDINELVTEMSHMLEAAINKKATLKLNLKRNLDEVEGDPTQLRQVIMNLVINASEAIEGKTGFISITTNQYECDTGYLYSTVLPEELPEGSYITIEVSDNGCGMDSGTMTKVFDPFFSTKFTGRGLGMAAVLGIVRGHKGSIKVYSEKGCGSSFKIILPARPRALSERTVIGHAEPERVEPRGTVLLVDDEELVRRVCRKMLKLQGVEVLEASNGNEALVIYEKYKEGIDWVILDFTMPSLNGEETFRELRKVNPDVKVVVASGYNPEEVGIRFAGKGLVGVIQKPYKSADLYKVLLQDT